MIDFGNPIISTDMKGHNDIMRDSSMDLMNVNDSPDMKYGGRELASDRLIKGKNTFGQKDNEGVQA